jgi:hypothetical protein
MQDKITCFKLNWYNRGLCYAEDAVQEEITVYRKDSRMVFRELNGYGIVCSCEIIRIEDNEVNKFFDFLEKNYGEWETDYKVKVCDGSEWKIRMWYSSRKVKKVCGTVKYPPNGKELEKYIRSFITGAKSFITPKLFGCS